MPHIEEMLEYNKKFVENRFYEEFLTTKYPDKKVAILTCMDTRLTKLLPAALNIKNGDVKMIKTAGALICHPFGSAMRSLLVAIYELDVKEILVIGHYDCGMQNLCHCNITSKMTERNISQQTIDIMRYCGMDIEQWLSGFGDPEESIRKTIHLITDHPLMPDDVLVRGFLIDPVTGRLDAVVA